MKNANFRSFIKSHLFGYCCYPCYHWWLLLYSGHHLQYVACRVHVTLNIHWNCIEMNWLKCYCVWYELLSDWNWKDSVEWAHWVDGDEGGTEREVNHDWKTGMWTYKMRMQCESCIIFFYSIDVTYIINICIYRAHSFTHLQTHRLTHANPKSIESNPINEIP